MIMYDNNGVCIGSHSGDLMIKHSDVIAVLDERVGYTVKHHCLIGHKIEDLPTVAEDIFCGMIHNLNSLCIRIYS